MEDDQVPGWYSVDATKIELQQGSFGGTPYNPQHNTVLELDSTVNTSVRQDIDVTNVTADGDRTMNFSFDYANRFAGNNTTTSPFKVEVFDGDGNVLFSRSFDNQSTVRAYQNFEASFEIPQGVEDITLSFTATGKSDCIGALIDNVVLEATDDCHGDDVIDGGAGDDNIYGNGGDDVITDNSGNNTVFGGDGDDHITTGNGTDVLHGGNGNDGFWAGGGNDTIYGGDGNDYGDGGAGCDTFFGGAGDDSFSGGAGNDMLYGQVGDDTLNGNDGCDSLYGGPGDDTLNGGSHNDLLSGGSGNDQLLGGNGCDKLYGNSGNDWLQGGNHNDILAGGSGCDSFVFETNDGRDTIKDFNKHYDSLVIDNSVATHISQVNVYSFDWGKSTLITFDCDNTQIVLENFKCWNVSSDMFDFANV